MIDWLRGHGVDDVVMSCGHLADGVRYVLGDGDALGVGCATLEEPRPLGTGGALKFAEDLLDERFLMLNGDVLTDIDLSAQIARARGFGRARDAGALSRRGPVGLRPRAARPTTASVTEFVEKPAPDQIDTNNISAGVYVLERSVLELLAPGEPASIERDVFPRLVGDGLYGHVSPRATGWTSGRPSATCRRTFDILEGNVAHRGGRAHGRLVRVRRGRAWRTPAGSIPSALVESGCRIGAGARIGGRRRARARRHGGREARRSSARS